MTMMTTMAMAMMDAMPMIMMMMAMAIVVALVLLLLLLVVVMGVVMGVMMTPLAATAMMAAGTLLMVDAEEAEQGVDGGGVKRDGAGRSDASGPRPGLQARRRRRADGVEPGSAGARHARQLSLAKQQLARGGRGGGGAAGERTFMRTFMRTFGLLKYS